MRCISTCILAAPLGPDQGAMYFTILVESFFHFFNFFFYFQRYPCLLYTLFFCCMLNGGEHFLKLASIFTVCTYNLQFLGSWNHEFQNPDIIYSADALHQILSRYPQNVQTLTHNDGQKQILSHGSQLRNEVFQLTVKLQIVVSDHTKIK